LEGFPVLGDENENSEAEVVDAAVETIESSTERKPLTDIDYPDHKWYVVNAHSGMEYKAKLSLEERVRSLAKMDLISEVIVPEETVVELVRGQKKTTKRKFFPGYILVKMKLTDESWHIIKNTAKISGFVGDKRNPVPVPESEIQRMTNRISEGAVRPKSKVNFSEGEKVRVVDGPFNNFNGVIEDINADKGKLRVLVSIFGRSTPVELDFVQVEKV
jgi:transcriptional antiterminator NusG